MQYYDIGRIICELPPAASIPPVPSKSFNKPKLSSYIRDKLKYIDENVKHDSIFNHEAYEKSLHRGESGYDSEGNFIGYK